MKDQTKSEKVILLGNIKISLKVLLCFILYSIFSLSIFYCTNKLVDYSWLNIATFIVIAQLIVNIIILVKLGYKLYSLPVLFIMFSFLFHCSHLFLITFNINVERPFDSTVLVDDNIFRSAIIFTIFVQMGIMVGVLLVNLKKKSIIKKINFNSMEEKQRIYFIGIILFIVGIIPKLYIDLSRIILYAQGNYLSTYEINVSGIISTISNFSEYGIMLLLIGKSENKKFCNKVLIFTIIYQGIIMMTGNRGRAVVFILSLVFIYMSLINKINWKIITKYCVLGYFSIIMLNFVGDLRMAEINDFKSSIELFKHSITNSPIFSFMAEFGATIITVCYSFMFFPSYVSFSGGYNYLLGLLTVLPNIGGMVTKFSNQLIFINNFPANYKAFLGGSYIGELYYSFGMYGIMVAVFEGCLLALIANSMIKSLRNENWLMLACLLVLFPNILWSIRSYFSGMVRECVWTIIFIQIVNFILKTYNNKSVKGRGLI